MKHCFTKQKIYVFLLCLLFVLSLVSCEKHEDQRTELALGTVCTVNLYEKGTKKLYDDCFSLLRELENKLSVKIKTSEISKINLNAGKSEVLVSEDTFFVLENAKKYAKISGGAFDPTIAPLVDLWDILAENPKIPKVEQIEQAKNLVNYENLILDSTKKTVFLTEKGMKLDIGGIAKGYAADKLVEFLKKSGIKKGLINLGGNIFVFGERSKQQKNWNIGIQNPRESGTMGILQINDATIVTSGDYERFFEKDGKRYHHIIDPKTGVPKDNEVMSFSIITDNSMIADVLSTACFVLGKDEGFALLEELGISAICITKDKSVYISDKIKAKFFNKEEFGFVVK